MMVKGVGDSAGAFLSDAEVDQRVGIGVIGIKRQTLVGARTQGDKSRVIVRVGEASAPVHRTYLRIGQRHRPCYEVWLQQGPQGPSPVRRPERIAIVAVKHRGSRCARAEAGAERCWQHGLKPGLHANSARIFPALEFSRYGIKSLSEGLFDSLWCKHVGNGV